MSDDELLAEQTAYYAARAGEYDEWFERRGRYDRGAEENRRWHAEVGEVIRRLDAFAPRGRVLDVAAGTGIWSEHLLRHAEEVTAVDAAAEMLAVHAHRVRDPRVRRVRADALRWPGDEPYDVVFFGFWLSHVPPERFAEFWDRVRSWLAPGGRVFFVDSRRHLGCLARDDALERAGETAVQRRLNDGRHFRIVKVFHDPDELRGRLRELGWESRVVETANYFLYGWAT